MFIGGINMSKKLLPDDSKLIELYVKDKKSCKEICRMYGLSVNSSSNLGVKLKKLGIEIRKDAGENHHNWKGGKIIKGDGYIGIWKPDHKKADSLGYVYEHTLVLEQVLHRELLKNEEVHHINLNKTDNDINNLCLCNHETHMKIHRSIEKLIPTLLKQNIIYFDKVDNEYKFKEMG